MEKFIMGIFFIIISIILFLIGHLCTVSYFVTLNSWSTPPGKYITALYNTGNIVPIKLSILFFAMGLCLVIIYFVYDKYIKLRKYNDKNNI